MRILITVILALAAAVTLTLLVREDPGYILIAAGPWTVETTVTAAAGALIVLFTILYLLVRAGARLWTIPSMTRRWRQRQRAKRARDRLTRGLIEMAEGSWTGALKTLTKQVRYSESPLVNYLAAARCAQMLGQDEQRDFLLQQAHHSTAHADIAVGLTQAELQLAHKQLEQALATTNHLRSLAPRHGYVIKLQMKLYRQLADWEKLRQLLPELRRQRLLTPDDLSALEIETFAALLESRARGADPIALATLWSELPKQLRSNSKLLSLYARHMINWNESLRVEPLLAAALESEWNDDLAYLYGLMETENLARLLDRAEAWLKNHPANPVLLLALARLCVKDRLWGKARIYLESSIGAQPTFEAYYELGTLLEQLGESDRAAECYREASQLAARSARQKQLGDKPTALALQPPVTPALPKLGSEPFQPIDTLDSTAYSALPRT